MPEWEIIPLVKDEIIELKELELPNNHDFDTNIETMHSDFMARATHLNEVENLHKQVLVTAGMIPEEHISHIEPSMKLKWLVDELNGRVNPDGLTIPMFGVEYQNIKIYSKETDNQTQIKIEIVEFDGQKFQRELK